MKESNITLSMIIESSKTPKVVSEEPKLPKRFLEIREELETPDEVITDYLSLLCFNGMRNKCMPGVSLEATRRNFIALSRYLEE